MKDKDYNKIEKIEKDGINITIKKNINKQKQSIYILSIKNSLNSKFSNFFAVIKHSTLSVIPEGTLFPLNITLQSFI